MTQTEVEEEMKRLEAKKIEEDRYATSKGDVYKTDGYYYKNEKDMGWTDSREKKD